MLEIHSLLRYVVLFLLLVAIFRGYAGWFGNREFTKGDHQIGLFLMIFTHIQFLLGLYLYFFSDMMQAMPGMATAMKEPVLRFWKVEHITGMLLAVILITVGRSMAKKAIVPVVKHRRSAVYYTLALILIIYTIPWALRGFNPF